MALAPHQQPHKQAQPLAPPPHQLPQQKLRPLTRLSERNLPLVDGRIKMPTFNRGHISNGIVHIGFGGFHRGHLARYTSELMACDIDAATNWGIIGTGRLPSDKRAKESLAPQDYLYTVVERQGSSENVKVVGSVTYVAYVEGNSGAMLRFIDRPTTRIVSLTVTENGYCLHPVTKKLDPDHPAVKHDVEIPHEPTSAIGTLVEAFARRRATGAHAFTALSCDNIQHNGDVLREAVLSLATMRDPSLAEWIHSHATFPNTMVDRITPTTKPSDVAYLQREYGLIDAWPIFCEAYTQWIVEDKFVAGRPLWEKVGVQFVADVMPYETMKLRLLNGCHLAVACLGELAGYQYIDEAMTDPLFTRFMAQLMVRETAPTLAPVPGVDVEAYQATLIQRFSNTAIKDTVERVATDAPLNTLLASLRDRLNSGSSIDLISLALAAWLRRVRGTNDNGSRINVRHPLAEALEKTAIEGGSNPVPLLSIKLLFGDLAQNKTFVSVIGKHLESLYAIGTLATMEKHPLLKGGAAEAAPTTAVAASKL